MADRDHTSSRVARWWPPVDAQQQTALDLFGLAALAVSPTSDGRERVAGLLYPLRDQETLH